MLDKRIINVDILHLKCIIAGLLKSQILNQEVCKSDKKIFVYLSGFYQNLGDMAITYSHEQFLKVNFSEYKIVMIPSISTYSTIRWVKRIINKDDIITIVGGGNIDSEYASLENCRRFIIHNFKKNKIVLFPQTMHFSENKYGNYRLKKTIRTYSKHKDIYIFAREYSSYEKMKDAFKKAKTVGVIPDMVLYLNFKNKFNLERNGALCVFRNDIEKACNFDIDVMHNLLAKSFGDVEDTDTVDVAIEDCKYAVYENTIVSFLKKIASKRLVVTDRLHCMIFCAITGTPCIAFDNSNKKISGVYNAWLNNLNYISVVDDYRKNEFAELVKYYESFDEELAEFEHSSKYDLIKNALMNN